MKKGKFIVIEGTDGSGKRTQLAKLVEKLNQKSIPFETTERFCGSQNRSAFLISQTFRSENS